MTDFLQLLIAGLATGAIYALAAIGFTLLWQTSQTINFAQGEFVMVPAFFALIAMKWLGLPVAIALLASILMMIGLYSVNLRIMGGPNVPLINEPTLFTMLQPANIDDYVMRPLIMLGFVIVAKLALDWFFATERGLAIRATGSNARMARAQGVNTVKVWDCSLQCYDKRLITEGLGATEGQYVWLNFLPMEDGDANAEMAAFLKYNDKPDGFGIQAWVAGEIFARAVNDWEQRTHQAIGEQAKVEAVTFRTPPTMMHPELRPKYLSDEHRIALESHAERVRRLRNLIERRAGGR